jgi:hypothetical protein
MRLILLSGLLAAGLLLGAGPAEARRIVPPARLEATITIWSGGKIVLKKFCAAERCAVCRDLVSTRRCGDPKLRIKYIESDTFLPLSRVRSIVIEQKGAQNADFFPARIVLRGGKQFQAEIMVRKRVLPLSFCGENDLDTISCLPATKVKSVEFK